MPSPLSGKRVLDLGALCRQPTHGLAASMAAKLCASYGASVVRPLGPQGEPFATAQPLLPDGRSALDLFLNQGKAQNGEGSFDIAIGDSAALASHAAKVPVKARLSVYGPGDDPPTSELALAALSGLLDIVGEAEGPPTRLAGHQLAYSAGLAAAFGLLSAIYSGSEQVVDVSLFDVAVWLNWKAAISLLIEGKAVERGNAANYWRVLPARDGYIALVYQERDWPALREMIGDPRLEEPRFASTAARSENLEALLAILRPWFAARSREEISRQAQSRRIPIGPVLFPGELTEDAQYRARGALAPDGAPRLPLLWDGRHIEGARDLAH